MTEVLSVPARLDSYYRPSSPRCHSPQRSYTPPYDSAVPRTPQPVSYNPYAPHRFSPPPSSASSSPQLSTVSSYSPASSVTSSICLDPSHDEDILFLPAYDFGQISPAPSPSPSPELRFRVEEEEGEQEEYDDEEEEDYDMHESQYPSRQSTPKPASRTISLQKPADDTFLRHEPSRHVDYLSHDWREEDIWASWRYMVGKRKIHSNSARLENASWRTWAKKKNGLRTVPPAKLNW